MRLAIVVGVPSYANEPELPGSAQDAFALETILNDSGRFDAILRPKSHLSAAVKAEIREFLSKHDKSTIEEFVFFFSGHGAVIDGDLRLILQDFSESAPNTTSIANTELDGWARGLKPGLYVKIIDACHSGVQYIKDPDAIPKIVEKGKEGFQHCYFWFSSLEDQASFADKTLSHFTRAIIESVKMHQADSISYNDLASAIADSFRARKNQTPYLVQQAKLTETFATITPELRRKLGDILNPAGTGVGTPGSLAIPPKSPSMIDRIMAEAKEFVSREDAIKFLERVRRDATCDMFDERLAAIYDATAEEIGFSGVETGPAARWLEKQPRGEFFVSIAYDRYHTDLAGNRLPASKVVRGTFESLLRMGMIQHVDAKSFVRLETGPWEALRIVATPKSVNLPKWHQDVIYALGGRKCVLFYQIVRYNRVGWDEFGDGSSLGWTVIEVEGAKFSETENIKIGKRLSAEILKELTERFGQT